MTSKTFSMAEVAKHNSEGDAWCAIDGEVFDLSKFARIHPGGKHIIHQYAGKDASTVYKTYHNDSIMAKYRGKLKIGDVEGYKPPHRPTPPGCFGDMVPFADPSWYQGFNSPYYTDSHRQWRAVVRKFVDEEIIPRRFELKAQKEPDRELLQRMGKLGIVAALAGPPWVGEYLDEGVSTPFGQKLDHFHWAIAQDEVARCGVSPIVAALTNGPSIACGGLLHFADKQLQRRYLPDVFMGRKIIALAVSEAMAGSDVAGITTTAVRDGDSYVINGSKKWITTGTYADAFSVLCKTKSGLSHIIVDRDAPGFSVRKLAIRDSDLSGTAYLTFNDVRVPASNLIGKEGDGWKITTYGFNLERLYTSLSCLRLSRLCIEESIRYTMRRRAFGKPLSNMQSIRMKIANMAIRVSQFGAWIEQVLYQMDTMSHAEANMKIGEHVALIKAEGARVFEFCATEATHCFGGQALFMTGTGRLIEPFLATSKAYAIPAGATDVMLDYTSRVIFKQASKVSKL